MFFQLEHTSQSLNATEWASELSVLVLVGKESPILIRNFILKYITQFTCEVLSL